MAKQPDLPIVDLPARKKRGRKKTGKISWVIRVYPHTKAAMLEETRNRGYRHFGAMLDQRYEVLRIRTSNCISGDDSF
jgi:hypothetical protein